jgi:hypothetical protein
MCLQNSGQLDLPKITWKTTVKQNKGSIQIIIEAELISNVPYVPVNDPPPLSQQ